MCRQCDEPPLPQSGLFYRIKYGNGEFSLTPVCFQYYETENIKYSVHNATLDPNPDPNPTHRTLSGKKPTTFYFVKNLVDHIKTRVSKYRRFPCSILDNNIDVS